MGSGTWLNKWAAAFWSTCAFLQNRPKWLNSKPFTNLLGFNFTKRALQRYPFWWGEHKTRNVIPFQQKKWKAKRVTSLSFLFQTFFGSFFDPFSVRTLPTVFLSSSSTHLTTLGRYAFDSNSSFVSPQTSHAFNPNTIQHWHLCRKILHRAEVKTLERILRM